MRSKGPSEHRFAKFFCTALVPIGIVVTAIFLLEAGTAWPEVVVITVAAILYANLLLLVLRADPGNDWSRAETWRSQAFQFYSSVLLMVILVGANIATFGVDGYGYSFPWGRSLLVYLGAFLVLVLADFLLGKLFRQPRRSFWRGRLVR
jgi:hypothetical protein